MVFYYLLLMTVSAVFAPYKEHWEGGYIPATLYWLPAP